jgi:hypothetical protein
MRKIRLDPDALRVDSFDTGEDRPPEGTVFAHATPPTMCGATCAPTCATNCDCTFALSCPVRCTYDTTA